MSSAAMWEIYAIKYATMERSIHENFLGVDPHESSPMQMDYYIWALVSGERVIVMDTGFDEGAARKRQGRVLLNSPKKGLEALGVNPQQVQDVIVSHMHYDHAGNHDLFPAAKFHIQDEEMAYCTGRYMNHCIIRKVFEADDVCAMVQRLFAGRVVFHDGDSELASGITLHKVGGHTRGLQMARVNTRRGLVVLASDASHYYDNMEKNMPYPLVFNVGDTLEAFRRIKELACSTEHVIPGHDPLVLKKYPAPRPELEGWIARLD